MPSYDYRCKSCGKLVEVELPMSEASFGELKGHNCSCGGKLVRKPHTLRLTQWSYNPHTDEPNGDKEAQWAGFED